MSKQFNIVHTVSTALSDCLLGQPSMAVIQSPLSECHIIVSNTRGVGTHSCPVTISRVLHNTDQEVSAPSVSRHDSYLRALTHTSQSKKIKWCIRATSTFLVPWFLVECLKCHSRRQFSAEVGSVIDCWSLYRQLTR